MGAKLHEPTQDGVVDVYDMCDGDLAVIVSWVMDDYVGKVLQRYGKYLTVVGAKKGSGFGDFFTQPIPDKRCRVRILQPGELIEVT